MKMTLQANILRAQDNLKGNIEMLIEAAKLVPGNPVVRNELGASLMTSAQSVMAAGQTRQAAAQYQMLLKYKPSEFYPIYHLVGLYMQMRDIESAKKALAYGLKIYPDSPLFIALRGKFNGSMGDPAAACKDFRTALDELPDYLPFWQDYEFFLRQNGNLAGAEKARKQIERLSE